ncbi:MAG: uroporphyrinogen decarboxylase family protein [Puniceicoccaceae bacterium]
MTHKERVLNSLNHQDGPIPVDFGSTFITGIHCSVVEQLRDYYGLEKKPVKVPEPYQMLGMVEDDLREAMGIDTTSIFPYKTIFGFPNEDWKSWQTPWGQEVLVSSHFHTNEKANGSIVIYPQGDRTAPPSAELPKTGYFFDTIERIDPDFDEDDLHVEDNLEEFGLMTDEDVAYWTKEAEAMKGNDRAILTHLNGTCLGDIALVPAPFLKNPKGVRGVADWYMLVAEEPDHVKKIFEAQTEIAVENMKRLHSIVGELLDVVVICGTDFGTQTSQFCSVDTYLDVWKGYYLKINDWIHENTTWKTFKHSCGAIEPLLDPLIESGFDIINPVQCQATGMDANTIKAKYGDRITFWGGGVNTQETLPFGTPEAVRKEVRERCEVLGKQGGFVFNSIHNVQALTPVENVVAMIETVRDFNAGK